MEWRSAAGRQELAANMMPEARAAAEKPGVRSGMDVVRRIAGAAAVGAHKTSMPQDLERGRPMEIDALPTVVQEIGRFVGVPIGVPMPTIDAVPAPVGRRAPSPAAVRRPGSGTRGRVQPPSESTHS